MANKGHTVNFSGPQPPRRLPLLSSPVLAFAQAFTSAVTKFSATRLTFTPSIASIDVFGSGTRAMLVVDDPAFASNPSIQLSAYDSGIASLYASINGNTNLSPPYAAVPVPWPAIFRIPGGGTVTIRTESGTTQLVSPTVAFSATLYTW